MDVRGETDPGPTGAQLAVLQALWTGVVNGWDDEDRHTRFLDQARAIGALPEAARRYGALRDDLDRGEVARKRLQAIALLATNELYATRTSRPPRRAPGWLVAVAVAVCVALLGWAALAFGVASR